MGFIAAFKYTYVANVAIIYASVPLMAAALEWAFLRVRPKGATIAMALVCLAGVGIIVSGGVGGGHFFGDMIAVAMTAGAALYMVMIRAFRETPVVWVGAVSAYILFAAGWLIVDPLAVSAADAWRMTGFGFTFACAVILWTEGTRLISGVRSPACSARRKCPSRSSSPGYSWPNCLRRQASPAARSSWLRSLSTPCDRAGLHKPCRQARPPRSPAHVRARFRAAHRGGSI